MSIGKSFQVQVLIIISNLDILSKTYKKGDILLKLKEITDKYNFPLFGINEDFAIFEFNESELIPLPNFILCAGNFFCKINSEENEQY